MNTAIIFIKNDRELQLSRARILDKSLIEYTISSLKKLDLDNIYLVGGTDIDNNDIIKRDNVDDVIDCLKDLDGKCLLLSPFYPLVSKKEYQRILNRDITNGAVCLDENETCAFFVLPNNRLKDFECLDFSKLSVEKTDLKRVNEFCDIPDFADEIKLKINIKHINNGVNIIDPYSTYIGKDVLIDSSTTIYPGVVIEGKCLIGKNNIITSNSQLSNVVIGDNNHLKSVNIENSMIRSRNVIGPNVHIDCNSQIGNDCIIDSFTEIKNSKIGKKTRVAHLVSLADAQIGTDVTIGCGATTINYDGSRKYATVIKDHAFIGSNANLIAPITIGEYSMVAAGSTIKDDVDDSDMAIARMYQTNKKGYGYKYINKEN